MKFAIASVTLPATWSGKAPGWLRCWLWSSGPLAGHSFDRFRRCTEARRRWRPRNAWDKSWKRCCSLVSSCTSAVSYWTSELSIQIHPMNPPVQEQRNHIGYIW